MEKYTPAVIQGIRVSGITARESVWVSSMTSTIDHGTLSGG